MVMCNIGSQTPAALCCRAAASNSITRQHRVCDSVTRRGEAAGTTAAPPSVCKPRTVHTRLPKKQKQKLNQGFSQGQAGESEGQLSNSAEQRALQASLARLDSRLCSLTAKCTGQLLNPSSSIGSCNSWLQALHCKSCL